LGKGVTGYYLIVNHAAVNTLTHGPNEHESHFVFDMAYNNHSDLQPDIFSTDTEGSNQLNFLLLHVIDRLFAPRYKSFNKKVGTIICFGDPERFKDCLIKPERSLNTELILSEEDNIKHIIASLLMGDMSQSHLIAKLSSKNFSSKTKRALWEMNGILMTEHLLNCIEYLSLRQAIQAALNRGEAYNQLRRHLERVNGRHVRGKNQTEIAINNECARLVSNCIVYYNGYLLNHLLARMEKEGNVAACEKIKHFSPVAWAHIHFHGKIDLMLFNEDMPIDIDALLASLEAIEIL
jgi:TnpA family transposase